MLNNNRLLYLICSFIILIGTGCQSKEPKTLGNNSDARHATGLLLSQITSPNETERFDVLEEVKKQVGHIRPKDIEQALTSLRKKNVSTLIFVLMETESNAIYKLHPPARMASENSEGSFPNIAYYYARVNPQRGLPELYRLYKEHPTQRLAICKAIGRVGTSEAIEFLMEKAEKQKQLGGSTIPHLAGLESSNKIVEEANIVWFLEQDLDREESILLAHSKARFTQEELVSLYNAGKSKRAYAIEYVFRDPSKNFEALCSIIEKEMANKQYDRVLQLLMSDSMRRSKDQRVKKYRESVITRIDQST